ncbi:MAG: hypothetical protein Kow0037_26550 [Calditrichia bacterium]
MKRIGVIALILLFGLSAYARAPFTEFKVGQFNPKKVKAGYLFGVNLGRMIDESISWSFEFNYFQKNYRETTSFVGEGTHNLDDPVIVQLEQEFTTRMLPLFFKLNYEHPLGAGSPFYARASAGLGWELLWNREVNYLENKKSTRFYHGFGWTGSGGVGFAISSSANLFCDLFYNSSKVKRNKKKNEIGLPSWEELDVSGLGFRIGISIVGFGW